MISDNAATGNGGAIWVTDTTTNYDRLFVEAGVVFLNNHAAKAYDLLPDHIGLYNSYINSGTKWSTPFKYGYNNYDISYVPSGVVPIESFVVTVLDSYASRTGVGNYVEGANVDINAGIHPEGKEFKYWTTTSADVVFDDVKNSITAFVMPAHDVVVEAVFGEIADVVLTGVVVESLPSKIVYVEGEILDLTGMVVTATFSVGSTKQVTNYLTNPANGVQLNVIGEQVVTVSYTENGVTKTATFPVTVNSRVHDWVIKQVVEPTCTEQGYTLYECSQCDETKQDVIPALGHAEGEGVVTVESTCETEGVSSFFCTRCDELLRTQAIPAIGHDFSVFVSRKDATCEEAGEAIYMCSRCDKLDTTILPVLGHAWSTNVVKPTCTEEGYTEHICANDAAHNFRDAPVDALGHDWDEGVVIVEPTEDTAGVMLFTCLRCGEERHEPFSHKHVYVPEIFEPTCTEQGYTIYTCDCGYSYSDDYVDAIGHSWNEGVVTTPATCVEDGEKTYTCIVCSVTKSEIIDALGHDLSSETIDPTCETAGSVTVTCSRCDYEDVTGIPAIGHDFTVLIDHMDADCETAGYDVFKCSRCDKTDKVTLPPLGHDWNEGVVTRPPTSDTEGTMTYTCNLCSKKRDETIPIPPPPGDTVVVNSVEVAVEVNADGVAVLKPTQEQMAAILATSGKEVVFDLRGQSSVALYISTTWLDKNTDKTITIKTDNGDTSVNTKTLWNNSGKMRLITVSNGSLELKNI